MSPKNKNIDVNLEVDGKGEVNITITEEKRSRIPRVGDPMFYVSPYPVDDDDEDARGKIKEDAILGYSYAKKAVKTTALTDEADAVIINGDLTMQLDDEMRIKGSGKVMVFTSEEDAMKRYTSLMTSSIEEAQARRDKYDKTVKFLENALEELHH